MLKIGIIGAGNIVKNRHLPALMKDKKLFDIVGIIDLDGIRSKELAIKYKIPNFDGYNKYGELTDIGWFKDIDAVIIAIPPKEHYAMVKRCLQAGKHVLVEKPFVVDINQGKELIDLAKSKDLVLCLNHNFQFSNSFKELEKIINSNELGNIRSIYGIQISNDTRRLPSWGDDLPLGLFYDESPHFFYLIKRFTGACIKVKNVYRVKSEKTENTPKILNIDLESGNIPVSIYLNFESPICEWYLTIVGEKKIAYVDLFRDILTILPNDGEHLMNEVVKTSLIATYSHWYGYFTSGLKYLFGKLYYGMDVTHLNFYKAITEENNSCLKGMNAEDGLSVNKIQHEIFDRVN